MTMSSDHKIRQKEKSKARNVKKKQTPIPAKKLEVRKISEKYLKEELQVEKSLKLRLADHPTDDDYAKQRQSEIDFFCDPFSSVPLESLEKLSQDDLNDPKDEIEIEQEDEASQKSEAHSARSNESPNTHLASTYVGHDNDPVVEKFELTRISYDELQLLFHPQAEIPQRSMTNDEEKALRFKRDEGIFIPDRPALSTSSNKALLLDRLHESGTTSLIDSSGDLRSFQKLFDDDVYRLVCDKIFTPIYVPPTPMSFDSIDKIISEKKFLKIFISQLMFDQHRLFTKEHNVAKHVEKLFAEYDRRKKMDIVGTLRSKLSNMREVKQQNFPTPDEPKSARSVRSEELSLGHQIKNVRQKLHVEAKYDHMVLKSLLENWRSLKAIRNQQTFSFTNIALKIQKFDIDLPARKAEWQQQYDAELNEMIAEEFDKYHTMKQKYKEFIKSANDPDSITDEQEVAKKPRKPDIDKIVAQLNAIYDEIPTDEPDLNIIMSNEHEASTDKPKEKIRKIRKYSYRIELEIDGEIVGSTKHCKLDEDFSIPIQSAFIVKLTKQLPEKIKLLVS